MIGGELLCKPKEHARKMPYAFVAHASGRR
jgi:hypothetical protein